MSELLPGSMATADMLADNPGTWLSHCHVADHMHAGMFATYTSTPWRRRASGRAIARRPDLAYRLGRTA